MCWESRLHLLTRLTRYRISDRVAQLSHACPSFLIFAGKMPPPSGVPAEAAWGRRLWQRGLARIQNSEFGDFVGRSWSCRRRVRGRDPTRDQPQQQGLLRRLWAVASPISFLLFSSIPLIFGGKKLFSLSSAPFPLPFLLFPPRSSYSPPAQAPCTYPCPLLPFLPPPPRPLAVD